MTLYSTIILDYCRVQLKKKKKKQTRHQVPRCWPHSSACRSPGHGIGRLGLMVTSHTSDQISGSDIPQCWPDIRDMGIFLSPYQWGNGHGVIQDGGRKRKWPLHLYRSSKMFPILLGEEVKCQKRKNIMRKIMFLESWNCHGGRKVENIVRKYSWLQF